MDDDCPICGHEICNCDASDYDREQKELNEALDDLFEEPIIVDQDDLAVLNDEEDDYSNANIEDYGL